MSSLNVQAFSGVGTIPEIIQGFVFVAVLFALLYSVEGLVKLYASYSTSRIELIPNTLSSKKALLIRQSPSKPTKLILPSDNQLTGVEFTYTFFLFVNPDTIKTEQTSIVLRQVFYKGYSNSVVPLLGPGVFIHERENKMRVVMNSYKNWFSFVDIENIPISKWFHVALVFRKNSLEVYVNGNIAGRIAMDQTYPYQNYQDVVVFGNTTYAKNSKIPKEEDAPTTIGESISGEISRLYYYRYALSYSEIQGLGAEGPSTTMEGTPNDFEKVPLSETWYTTGQT